jgi:hypothetical protein
VGRDTIGDEGWRSFDDRRSCVSALLKSQVGRNYDTETPSQIDSEDE